MEKEPKGQPTWIDKALIIAVFTFVLWALFFLPAHAGEEMVLTLKVCSPEKRCQEVVVEPPPGTSLMQCVQSWQIVGIQWLAGNKPEGWKAVRGTCGPRRGSA